MDFLNDLLGLLVLTGPLWLILLSLIVAGWAAFIVARRLQSGGGKVAATVGVFALIFLVLFGDELAGRAYLNYLCEANAGAKVYQTMELPAGYWDEEGNPTFFNRHGNLDRELWTKILDESEGQQELYSVLFAIDRSTSIIKDRATQDVLAEVTTFRHWGGWIRRNISLHNTASSCGFLYEPDFSRNLYGRIFAPPLSN